MLSCGSFSPLSRMTAGWQLNTVINSIRDAKQSVIFCLFYEHGRGTARRVF